MWLARVPVPSGFAAAMASMSMDGIPLVLRFSSGYVGVITYSNNIVAVIDAASKAGWCIGGGGAPSSDMDGWRLGMG